MLKTKLKQKQKLHVKIGDNVKVISGFYKNKSGEIIKIYPRTGKILIKGLNIKVKHCQPEDSSKVGEIVRREAPIHHSNVKLNLNDLL